MPQVTDPVCGMTVDSEHAVAREPHGDHEHFFCSTACARAFRLEPTRYTAAEQLRDRTPPRMEEHGIVTPMFGSAGSGGAEYEPAGDFEEEEEEDEQDRP